MKPIIVGIGEILWDMLPTGKQLGGAPMNFAFHAKKLNGNAYIVSKIANDTLGNEIIEKLNPLKLSNKYLQIENLHPTGTVDVKLDNNGIPKYIIHENVAWDFIEWNLDLKKLAQKTSAVCFGSLAQRNKQSRNSIINFLKTTPQNAIKLFDINLRQNFYSKKIIEFSLKLANVLKLNDEELIVLAKMFDLTGDEKILLDSLIKLFNLKLIALTRGVNGSLLASKNETSEHPGFKVEVVDTVGAGDSFSAAIVHGLLNNNSLDEINLMANKTAASVCAQKGGTS